MITYKLIVLLPLFGAMLALPIGKIGGPRVAEVLTSGLMVIVACLSWYAFFNITGNHINETYNLVTWMNSGDFKVSWGLKIDTLTAVMLVVVNTVSSLVHVYSIGYMSHDPHRPRFFAYLSLFTFAMLMLLTAPNFLQMFFGWEGVGLASYLLIGFWFKKPTANAAAIKAFLVNRVGDFGFVLGIMATFIIFGSVDFAAVLNPDAIHHHQDETIQFLSWEFHAMTTACLLLFVGAMGKSAQFFLHTWLPDAMEGPTPVSALIHAATMVTAGVFMVCRLSPMFEAAPMALMVVTLIGATTAIFAATVGLFQTDIKRVIAYSTCSQLGYMFFAAGVSAYPAAMFHLFTHAFFKALLFLGAGSVIHAMSDEQDMRNMGGIRKGVIATYALMMVGTIALTGIGLPGTQLGFAGFFSKDAIIEVAFASGTTWGNYAFYIGVLAAALTSFYSFRLIFLTFHGKPRASEDVMSHVHDSPLVMMIPLYILAAGAVAAGFIFYPMFLGHGMVEFWGAALPLTGHSATVEVIHHAHEIKETPSLWWVLWAPFVVTFLGLAIAYYFYIRHADETAKRAQGNDGLLYNFFKNKWYFDELYDLIFVRPAMRLGHFLWKVGDGKIIDGFGPDGISKTVLKGTRRVMKMQSGYLYDYAFAMLVGVAALATYLMFAGGSH